MSYLTCDSEHQQGAVELPWLYFGWALRPSIFISSQWLINSTRVDKIFFAAGPRWPCSSAGCDNCKDLWCWNLTNNSPSTFALSSARLWCFEFSAHTGTHCCGPAVYLYPLLMITKQTKHSQSAGCRPTIILYNAMYVTCSICMLCTGLWGWRGATSIWANPDVHFSVDKSEGGESSYKYDFPSFILCTKWHRSGHWMCFRVNGKFYFVSFRE